MTHIQIIIVGIVGETIVFTVTFDVRRKKKLQEITI